MDDSDTRLRTVRPEQLHLVGAEFLVLPGADIADFAAGVVVPSLTGHWVGDRLGELVGSKLRSARRAAAGRPATRRNGGTGRPRRTGGRRSVRDNARTPARRAPSRPP